MTPEARKRRSEDLLTAAGVVVSRHLPSIEAEAETRLRTPQETARRLLVLLSTSGVAHGLDRESIVAWLQAELIWDSTSHRERQFLLGESAPERRRVEFTWNLECAWVLAWALGLVEALGLPVRQSQAAALLQEVPAPGESTREFVRRAKLRAPPELLDVSDLLYRAHWSARNARINGRPSDGGPLNEEVVVEWHRAINWLTWYSDEEDWDEITTDT